MPDGIVTILAVFAFLMGACIASFLNVVIWRVPRGESIVSPPSHCPRCNAPIRWYQNLPILSYLALRGRCASCRTRISPRYLFVELLGGLLFLAAFWRFGWFAPLAWVWLSLMIVGTFVDYDIQMLPDFVTVGGMVYGVATAVVFWSVLTFTPYHFHNLHPGQSQFFLSPVDSLAGLAFGFGLLWLVRWLGSIAFRREAMGLGDVFLLGAVGAVCGPLAVLVTLILSSFLGALVGIGMILLSKAKLGRFVEIPYGPYICMGCTAWLFAGPELVNRYLSLLGMR